MSRLFDGVDDLMTFAGVTFASSSGARTILIVLKNLNGSTWESFIEMDQGASDRIGFGNRGGGNLYIADSSFGIDDAGQAVTGTGTWWVLAFTCPSGAGAKTGRLHKMDVGGTNISHASLASTHVFGSTSDRLYIGGNDDPANMRVAAAAIFDAQLTDAQIEGIATAKTTQSIADLSPVWLADDSDAFATNLVNPGTWDRSALTGTADDADDPTGWVYGLGGGGGTLVLGAASLALTLSRSAVGKRVAIGATALALTLTRSALGHRVANAAASLALTATRSVTGARRALSSAALALTLARTTIGQRKANAAASLALTLNRSTVGHRLARAAAALPLTLTVGVSGFVGSVIQGAADLALTFARAVSGQRRANAASSEALTFDASATGRRTAIGAAAKALTLDVATTAKRRARGAASLALSLAVSAVGLLGQAATAVATRRTGIRLGASRTGIRPNDGRTRIRPDDGRTGVDIDG